MPVITPAQHIIETNPQTGSANVNRDLWISEAGGLTQFGAFIQELQPGTRSSTKHWHAAEDEMVYVLEGELTLVEGDTETVLRAGDAATFKAGVAVGHFLCNRSDRIAKGLVVGTRAPLDHITYPELDRVCVRDRALPDDVWTDTAGNPVANPFSD